MSLDQVAKANHSRQYLNTQLAEEITKLETSKARLKDKYVSTADVALTMEELVRLQRERIQDLEDWMRDVCQARSLGEAQRLAHEALW